MFEKNMAKTLNNSATNDITKIQDSWSSILAEIFPEILPTFLINFPTFPWFLQNTSPQHPNTYYSDIITQIQTTLSFEVSEHIAFHVIARYYNCPLLWLLKRYHFKTRSLLPHLLLKGFVQFQRFSTKSWHAPTPCEEKCIRGFISFLDQFQCQFTRIYIQKL